MRKLIYGINLTLDGCCDHSKVDGDNDTHEYHTQLLREADTFLYGRVTYQLMVPFWPDVAKKPTGDRSMDTFAKAFDAIKKIVVFSKSLDKAEGNKTVIIRNNLKEEILRLKQETGKSILTGGVDIPSQLIQLGLVDECHILYQPIIVGEGRRLFDDLLLKEKAQFKLAASKVFPSGIVALKYERS